MLTLIIWAFVLLASASASQVSPHGNQNYQHYIDRWWPPEPIVVVTFLVLIVYALQLTQMIRAANATRDSVEATRNYARIASNAAERDLRAYVHCIAAEIKFPQKNVPEAHVVIKNVGRTPAYNVQEWIGIYLGPYPLQGVLPPPPEELQMARSILPPGGHTTAIIPFQPPIPDEIVPLLGTQAHTIYVYGEIRYEDVFRNPRRTRYRLIYGGIEEVRPGILKPDREGNEAD